MSLRIHRPDPPRFCIVFRRQDGSLCLSQFDEPDELDRFVRCMNMAEIELLWLGRSDAFVGLILDSNTSFTVEE